MTFLVAALAVVVAAEYAIIAVYIVPRLARLTTAGSPLLSAARWGAAAFFIGCSLTHLGIALQLVLDDHAGGHLLPDGGTDHVALLTLHTVPHVAQVVGGALFIVVARSHLEINLTTKTTAEWLREREQRFRAAFDRAPTGVALVDVAPGGPRPGLILQANPALCRLLGMTEEDLLTTLFQDLVRTSDVWRNTEAFEVLLRGEAQQVDLEERLLHRDGHDVWVSVNASLVRDDRGQLRYAVVLIRDVGSEREEQRRLRHLAENDSLTEVLNRRRFGEELDTTLARVRRYGDDAALLVVDLDQFKYVNDTYGHRVGDELLRRTAAILRARVRSSDSLGRLGGDEFGVLCSHTDAEAARRLALDLLEAVRSQDQIEISGRIVRTTASIGIRPMRAQEAKTAEEILAEADVAMYESKETGRDRVSIYTTRPPNASGSTMRSRLAWSERIRDALDHDGFRLFEQPILSLLPGQSDRSELLVRMVDHDGGMIRPGEFLEVAERFGQVQAIDRWVFRRALALLARRQAAGDHRILEVNLSGVSVSDEDLVAELAEMIVQSPADPSGLIVEVTETAAIRTLEHARAAATALSALGCRFTLDDFGSGFGSFYYLKHLPFDGVKIDGDFVKDLPHSREDRLTLEAIASIAHALGKETTAEFVQNEETIHLLRELGVAFAQGYYVGRPQIVEQHMYTPALSRP